jgi:hypothetical protein
MTGFPASAGSYSFDGGSDDASLNEVSRVLALAEKAVAEAENALEKAKEAEDPDAIAKCENLLSKAKACVEQTKNRSSKQSVSSIERTIGTIVIAVHVEVARMEEPQHHEKPVTVAKKTTPPPLLARKPPKPVTHAAQSSEGFAFRDGHLTLEIPYFGLISLDPHEEYRHGPLLCHANPSPVSLCFDSKAAIDQMVSQAIHSSTTNVATLTATPPIVEAPLPLPVAETTSASVPPIAAAPSQTVTEAKPLFVRVIGQVTEAQEVVQETVAPIMSQAAALAHEAKQVVDAVCEKAETARMQAKALADTLWKSGVSGLTHITAAHKITSSAIAGLTDAIVPKAMRFLP